ncbi:hypothetical protein TNCT_535341 [Trichonephila clavata]|uniref:Uncharacterized protein n=1 Tax=Trichonephila clavata TaxID=2740835 RepID=A0A8X6LNU9_TRICU|nr:hypothetical protein TNCT_535341 [Trichonephila clavata]
MSLATTPHHGAPFVHGSQPRVVSEPTRALQRSPYSRFHSNHDRMLNLKKGCSEEGRFRLQIFVAAPRVYFKTYAQPRGKKQIAIDRDTCSTFTFNSLL